MKMTEFTPYKRVMTALNGDMPDKTPFTMYENKVPRCTFEREMRDRGLCMVKRIASYKMYCPNVKVQSLQYSDERGRSLVRTTYSTQFGDVSNLVETAGFTSWKHEYEFKSPDDYKVLLFMINDTVVEPDYAAALKTVKDAGEDYVVRDTLNREPLNTLISGYMSTNDFCIEWMDNRDEVLKLYEALVRMERKIYPVVADGPLEFANYGGNVIPEVVGVENFKKYYVPHYNEAAEILHKKGKLIGSHFDADNTTIMDEIAETDLDYIEAYDPGMSPPVKEARKRLPGKVLWLNWPSSWHLEPVEKVYSRTLKILEEASPGNDIIIGITEDVPEERRNINYKLIMDAIDDYYK